MKLLGLPIAEKIKEELMRLPKPSVKLAIVQVGDDPVSSLYVKKKQEFAKEISVNTIVVKTTSGQIDQKIDELNRDHSVKAIIIQLPLPEGLSRNKLLAKISMHKDVDGFRYILGEQFITYPPTVLAIDDIFEFYKIQILLHFESIGESPKVQLNLLLLFVYNNDLFDHA